MNIAVNTRFLLPGKMEGIGYFSFETMQRIVTAHPEHRFNFLFDRPFDPGLLFADNVSAHVVSPPARHPLLWHYWFQFRLPNVIKRLKSDLLLSLDGYLPLRLKIPTVNVIHDLAFEFHPEHMDALTRYYYHRYMPRFAKASTRLATVSEFSKKTIVERYNIEADDIDVVFGAANDNWKPMDQSEREAVAKEYSKGFEYFIYVGAQHPRKNIPRLLKAFEHFKRRTGRNTKLLIVGRKGWKTGEIYQVLHGLWSKSDIIFTDYVKQEDLRQLVASSLGLVFVSMFEGFGLPILEAMYCDVPVICSNTSSMPEVAGNAALSVDPLNVEEISDAMEKLQSNPILRAELIRKGREQREKFSWDRSADILWDTVEKALNVQPT